MNQEKLKNNFMSLIRSLEKYGASLEKVLMGEELYQFTYQNFYTTEFMNVYNKYNTPIVFSGSVPSYNYEMRFDESKPRTIATVATAETVDVVVSSPIIIIESQSSRLKKDLKPYVGKTGVCLLNLKNQGQYVVEFPNGDVVAFPSVNVKAVENLSLILDAEVTETYSNGKTYPSTVLKAHASGDEVENYLRSHVGKVDAVTITKRYFLTEID